MYAVDHLQGSTRPTFTSEIGQEEKKTLKNSTNVKPDSMLAEQKKAKKECRESKK